MNVIKFEGCAVCSSEQRRVTAAGVSLVSAHLTPSLAWCLEPDRRDGDAASSHGLRAIDGRAIGAPLERHIQ